MNNFEKFVEKKHIQSGYAEKLKTLIGKIDDFMKERGGYTTFYIGKSSETQQKLQERHKETFQDENDVKILLEESPEVISELETLLIEWFLSEYTPDGLFLINKTSASTGNSDANQIYVSRKRNTHLDK